MSAKRTFGIFKLLYSYCTVVYNMALVLFFDAFVLFAILLLNSCILTSSTIRRTSVTMVASNEVRLSRSDKVKILRSMLDDPTSLTLMPCCYDGMSAKLVEAAGIDCCG